MKLIYSVVLFFLLIKICVAQEEFRKWTSSSGQILEAKFIKFSGNSIVLKRVDGRQFTLSPKIFIESDRQYLRSLKSKQSTPQDSKFAGEEFYIGATLVLALNGQVEIMSSFSNYNEDNLGNDESDSNKLVKVGDILSVGSKIKVSSGSEMTLLFSSGTIARLGENSIFSISEFTQKDFKKSGKKVSELNQEVSPSTLLLNLNIGDLIVDVKKLNKESSFEVRTDLGVAGIRGTSFQLFVSEDMSKLSVLSGSVKFTKTGGSPINTLANKVIVVERDNNTEVADINPGEKEFINAILERIKKDADGIDLSTLRGKLGMKHKFHVIPSAGNMEMIWVEPGQIDVFEKIIIKNGFYLGKYEVTQEQYAIVKSNSSKRNPSQVKGNKLPVDSINSSDARSFIARLNYLEKNSGGLEAGWSYSLPTYSELEFACRAGTTTKYYWGDELNNDYAFQTRSHYWNRNVRYLSEIGSFPPNPWGFHDLIGNAGEWTKSRRIFGYPFDLDRNQCFRDSDLKKFIKPVTNLSGNPIEGYREIKIGEYNQYPGYSGFRVILKKD